MTHFEKTLQQYIESSINSMKHTISWTSKQDWTYEKKLRYAQRSIKEEYERAWGAIQFASIYAEAIDDKTAERFRNMLSEEEWKLEESVYEAMR